MTWQTRTHTASDGYVWNYRLYPTGRETPRARLICLHGIQSHAGWYEASCTHLAAQGYEVLFVDRRGSGVNSTARGDMPSFRRVLDDVGEFLKSLPTDRPRVLVGISWGGKLSVALQMRQPGLVDAQVLLCPGLRPKIVPSFFTTCRVGLASFITPGSYYPIPLSDPELFTRTPRWLEFLRTDPLALHQATARFLAQNFWLDIYLGRCAQYVKIPSLLLQAGHDAIIDNVKTARYCEHFNGPLEILGYPDAYHTLEFEPNGPPFVDDLLWWLGRRLV